jgi:hypothetical protein
MSVGGKRMYCDRTHTKEHGMEPAVQRCAYPGCRMQPHGSEDSNLLYCTSHMQEFGEAAVQSVSAS